MYSIKIAAKLVKIKQLYKKAEEQLSNFIVLSTYYLTFRLVSHKCNDAAFTVKVKENATSIVNVNTTQTDSKTVYDMSGRRVTNPKKGIYIVGGKKMVK